jgi:hypothetical protein
MEMFVLSFSLAKLLLEQRTEMGKELNFNFWKVEN